MGNSHGSRSAPLSLKCAKEPGRYRRACWHYQAVCLSKLKATGKPSRSAMLRARYVSVCFWGLGKWIAGRVSSAGGTNEEIITLCNQGQMARLGLV